MRKVLLIVPNLAGGGTETFVNTLFVELVKEYDVRIVYWGSYSSSYEKYRDHLIKLSGLEAQKSMLSKVITSFKRAIALRKVKKHYSPDVTIAFNFSAMKAITLTLTKNNIVSIRNNHFMQNKKKVLQKVFFKLSYYLETKFVVQNTEQREYLIDKFFYPKSKIFLIENFLDPSYIDSLNSNDYLSEKIEDLNYYIYVGRLETIKNIELLIKGFNLYKENNQNDMKLLILGKGSQYERLQFLVKKYDLEEDVIFRGFVRNPYALMSRSKGLFLLSFSEGFPNVVMEALYLNIPVCVTKHSSSSVDMLGKKRGQFSNYDVYDHGILLSNMENYEAVSLAMKTLENTSFTLSKEFILQKYNRDKTMNQWKIIMGEKLERKRKGA